MSHAHTRTRGSLTGRPRGQLAKDRPESRLGRWRVIAGCLGIWAMTGATVVAQNVSVSDYSVPVSRADNLRIDALTFDAKARGDSIVSQSGDMTVVYKTFFESLPFAYSIDIRGTGALLREPIVIERDSSTTDTTGTELTGTANVNVLSRIKKYRRDTGNIFTFGDADLDLDTDKDRPGLDVTAGFGWGRFINATALRKAVRIEDFLVDEGIISERLPKETMIDLGHIIEKESEYRELYGDRYQNYWYEDMQNEIQKSRKVLGSIGAIGVLRMQEVLEKETINERFYGWDVSAGVQLEALTPVRGQDRDDPALSLELRYSRPISWSTQFNTDFNVNTPLSGGFGKRFDMRLNVDFVYEITNKINYRLVYLFRSEKRETFTVDTGPLIGTSGVFTFEDVPVTIDHSIANSFSFFTENKIGFTTSLKFDRSKLNEIRVNSDRTLNLIGRTKPWETSFSTFLEYRIF
jgi:hypothetical protein